MKRKDVEKMQADGLISAEQSNKIIDHYHLDESTSGRWLFICLSLLAAALLAGGAGMLVVAHWEELTDLGKTATGAVLLAAVWAAYFAVRKPFPLLAEGLAALGGILWGVNIMLHAYIFETDTTAAEGFFLLFIGIAFIPFLTNQRALVVVAAGASLVLLISIVSPSPHDISWLHPSWLSKRDGNQIAGNILAAFALLDIFWWLIGEKSRRSEGVLRGYFWLSAVSLLFLLLKAQFLLLYCGRIQETFMLTWQGYALLAAAPALCMLLKPRDTGWLSWLLMAGSTCALAPMAIHISWLTSDWPITSIGGQDAPTSIFLSLNLQIIAGVAVCVAYAIILMCTGLLSRRIAWINYGSLMVVFIIISVMTNIFKSLENSGLALIIAGSLVLVVVLLLESQRRRLVKKIKQQSTPTPSEA